MVTGNSFMKQECASIVHSALKKSGINFVAYLPDDQIHDAQKMIVEDSSFTTVAVTTKDKRWPPAPAPGSAKPSPLC
jgi:sulfopyruvate decarboxylase TPP-binding subunit